MSDESLRSIFARVNALEVYIGKIPKNAGGVGVEGLKTKIGEACRMLPSGRHYDDVVKDLRRLLPVTIDKALRDIEVFSSQLCEPYGPHIITESRGILAELQSFRMSYGWVLAVPGGQEGRVPAMVEMRTLLCRLQKLNDS